MFTHKIRNLVGALTLSAAAIFASPAMPVAAGGCGTLWNAHQYCSAHAVKRISFPRGGYGTTIWGRLENMYDENFFLLRARAGQHLNVSVTSSAGSARVFVYAPNGALVSGAPGGVDIDSLPQTGDYKIKVIESMMGSQWQGWFKLRAIAY